MTQLKRVEKNIIYAMEQAERFLKYEYGIKYNIEVYGHKKIEKQGKLSRLEMKNGKPYAIDIAYSILKSGNREKILYAVLREAVKIANWYRRLPYKDGDLEYEQELKKYGLPSYGKVSQTGKELHTYQCEQCKKIYFLRVKKLPKSKDVSEQNVRTNCCKARFEYAGKIMYTNQQLQQIQRKVGR